MAIEDLTDVKPGEKYTRAGGVPEVYVVESICKFPTVTLRRLEADGTWGKQVHGAVGSPLLEQFTKVEEETFFEKKEEKTAVGA